MSDFEEQNIVITDQILIKSLKTLFLAVSHRDIEIAGKWKS